MFHVTRAPWRRRKPQDIEATDRLVDELAEEFSSKRDADSKEEQQGQQASQRLQSSGKRSVESK